MEKKIYLTTNLITERDGTRTILPKGSEMVVGKDITAEQAERLMEGGEVTEKPLSSSPILPDKAAAEKLNSAFAEIDMLSAEIDRLSKENTEMEKALREAKNTIVVLNTENDTLTNENTQLRASLEELIPAPDQAAKEGKKETKK